MKEEGSGSVGTLLMLVTLQVARRHSVGGEAEPIREDVGVWRENESWLVSGRVRDVELSSLSVAPSDGGLVRATFASSPAAISLDILLPC